MIFVCCGRFVVDCSVHIHIYIHIYSSVNYTVATNQLARAKDSCDERRRCASMRENAYNDFR